MDSIHLTLRYCLYISPPWHKAPYPSIGILHEPLFPAMVGVAEIDWCLYHSLKFLPCSERNIVIGGDTFDGHTTEYTGERITYRGAFSVGELQYACMFRERFHYDEEYPGAVL